MTEENSKIKNFYDLNTWKKGHELVLLIYKMTKKFPKDELFGLSNQMRKATVSITSNIAEGFSRGTAKDKCHFYLIAQGSLSELQSQLFVARDEKYINQSEFNEIYNLSIVVNRLINGLRKIGNV